MSLLNLKNMKRIHFVGIGGAGMGGIAEISVNLGHEVTGSDPSQNAMTQHLKRLKITIFTEHQATNVIGADLLVSSTAISQDNPELIAARAAGIPTISRAEMLAALMQHKNGIAIAGTHGKTTTTSLIASVLAEGKLDPTFVIGGLLKSAGANAHMGEGPLFVVEADESDASFLCLHPKTAVVTNIDADHLETYQGDFNQLRETFVEFLHRLPEDGLAVVCFDDPVIQQIIPAIQRPVLTYGFDANADFQLLNFQAAGFQSHFTIRQKANGQEVHFTLNLPGRHNALNAAATYIVATTLGVSDAAVATAFQQFAGVGRRMQVFGDFETARGRILLVDDYGHHPREITATWQAVRQAWPDRRLVVIYQPHRYTRTRDLFSDFVDVLSQQADQLILLDIYPAGEVLIEGADGVTLFNAVNAKSATPPLFVPQLDQLSAILHNILKNNDILLTQGAGNIGTIAPKLADCGFDFLNSHSELMDVK